MHSDLRATTAYTTVYTMLLGRWSVVTYLALVKLTLGGVEGHHHLMVEGAQSPTPKPFATPWLGVNKNTPVVQ